MILKRRKSFSTLFPTSKRQIETPTRFHFIGLTNVPIWQHVLWSSLWGNRCSHMLLVGIQNDTAIMKRSFAVSSKIMCVFNFWLGNSSDWNLLQRYSGKNAKRYLHKTLHSRTVNFSSTLWCIFGFDTV